MKLVKKLLLLTIVSLFIVSCSDEKLIDENKNQARYACEPQVVDINAGQHILSGNVTIGNNADFLYVTYNANESWNFKELHLYVGPLSGVPTRNGNPIPGRFPYKVSFNTLNQSYTFEIPMSNVVRDQNGCFVVAAHSAMVKTNAGGSIIQSETGWAGYNDFPGNNWGRFFDYCACSTIELL